ncbi:MAG: M23 family metallopeptidase [Chitinophagaceae bacterium]
MKPFLINIALPLLILITVATAQPTVLQPDGGGSYKAHQDIKDELSPDQRKAIIKTLQASELTLRKANKLQLPTKPDGIQVTPFSWPIKQAPGFNDPGFYGIVNYVDEDPAYPNSILDYNCGNRSYDQPSGYNHQGTDISTWPYPWQKMERNAVQIIAAAPGTILYKSDGNFDQNCAFCTSACDWNAVYIMQADGSVAWYGHMKSGSLTTKLVGQTVATGEYLGVIGSSGNSTGPHLHFEVYTNSSYTQLVDPWAGPCNALNGLTSWWANQQPYYTPTLLKVMTHAGDPANNSCPTGEVPNEKINFANGESVYLGGYYRDQQPGQQSIHTIYQPDSTVYFSFSQNFNDYYSLSWWYYIVNLTNPAPSGTWRYEIVYNGTQKQSVTFGVNIADIIICPNSYNPLTSNLSGSSYQWQVNTGTGFVNISDNSSYAGTTARQLQLKTIPSSFYGYQYRCFVNGNTYSNALTLKFSSTWVGGASTAWENPSNWSCGNMPDANTDLVIQAGTFAPAVNSNVSCRSTTVKPGTTITVKSGFKLTVTH